MPRRDGARKSCACSIRRARHGSGTQDLSAGLRISLQNVSREVRYYFAASWFSGAAFSGKSYFVARERRQPMSKQHFYFKLIPPRPTFGADMTAEERTLMQEHVRYTREAFDAGKVLIYGPVLASAGAFGVAILEMNDPQEVQTFGDEDPSVKAGLNRFEFYPMRVAAARGIA